MCGALIRSGTVGLVAILTLVFAAGAAHADFLILENGRTFRGELTSYPDGSVTTSESEYRYDKEKVARSSTEETVDEVIENWGGEIGECDTACTRKACLSLAKFCVVQERYKAASRFFARWGKQKGWKVYSSKFYFILSDTKVKRVKEIGARLDAIMRFYQKEFGAERAPKQDFVVRFFKSENQFDAFAREAGMAGAGAFYHPATRELVLWDMSLTNKNLTFEAVYHEANHQYVGGYYLDHEPGHCWLSEGLATYYETAKYRSKRIVAHGGKARCYLDDLRHGDRTGKLTPLAEFLSMGREEFYCGGGQESVNYAQAWGVVYFLKNTKDKRCREFLGRYLETLKETKDDAKALAAALDGVACAELEEAFGEFRKRL